MQKPLLKPSGKLFTSNPAGLKKLNVEAELLQITRAGFDMANTVIVRSLSPSPYLFRTFATEWRYMPPTEWWPKYEKRFLEELKTDEKLKSLREVYKKLLRGKNVVLICFCQDHRFCHRRLVAEFFKPYGVVAEELDPITEEQTSLF